MRKDKYMCSNPDCRKEFTEQEAIEKESISDGCRYYCSKKCCENHYLMCGGNKEALFTLECPCW